jgi:hypothetical protein
MNAQPNQILLMSSKTVVKYLVVNVLCMTPTQREVAIAGIKTRLLIKQSEPRPTFIKRFFYMVGQYIKKERKKEKKTYLLFFIVVVLPNYCQIITQLIAIDY